MSERLDERRSKLDRRRADRRRTTLPQLLEERRAPRNVSGRRRTDRQRHSGRAATSVMRHSSVPFLLTVDEVVEALRTTRKAVYALVERAHLPGVVRVRRRILVRQASLLQWLQEKGAPSLRETER